MGSLDGLESTVSTKQKDSRAQRGRVLASAGKVESLGKVWLVHSQSSSARYVVNLDERTCTCKDHEERGIKCKHQFAVEFTVKQETFEFTRDGEAVQATRTETKVRVSYKQDWPAYNRAQQEEKATVQLLLRSLCDSIVTPPQRGRGQRSIPLSDAVYAMTMKVYVGMSGRRASTDIDESAKAGRLLKPMHYNSVFNYFEKSELAPLLSALVEESAAPLASIEKTFAPDSTGFSTSVYRRWYDAKYGREMKEATWVKAHAMTGVKTNVVTALVVTDGTANDSPLLPPLVEATKRRFNMREVVADKAYLSHDNLALIEQAGAQPFIPFKANSLDDGSPAWKKMRGLFLYQQDFFFDHYHQRSNVESTFSAIKRLFGASVRSKLFVAQRNEVLCKALAYNLTVLVHAIHELGITPFPTRRAA